MATLLLSDTTLPDHVRASDRPSILSSVLMPQVTLAIWNRGDTAPAAPSLEVLATIDDICLTAPVATLSASVRVAMTDAGYPAAIVAALGADIAMLADRLARLLDRDAVSVRLEVVETDACRRFHADYVSVRLICTYAGTGTQWLDDRSAALLRDGVAPGEAAIRHLGTGDVGLFKGREWAGDRAIIHRSPPIAGTGERRLLLVIDPAPDVCR